MELYDFLAKGGPVMVPILLFSIIALAAFIERLWALRRSQILPSKFLDMVMPLIEQNRIEEAHTLAESSETAAGRLAEAGLRYAGRRRSLIHDVLEEAGRKEVVRMEKISGLLSTIATASPLLGLLGTVTGMIRVFQQIVINGSESGDVNAAALAGGIWEAMMTTAAGLCVAIPAFLAFQFILSKIDNYADELSQFGETITEALSPEDEQPRVRESSSKKSPKKRDSDDSHIDDSNENNSDATSNTKKSSRKSEG